MSAQRDELASIITDHVHEGLLGYDACTPHAEIAEAADDILAAGYRKLRTITTADELDAAIVRAFEEGENLVLLNGWRPWIIWENDHGYTRVSSLPVEGDPDLFSLSDIPLPAIVLHEPEAEATR